MTNCTQAVLPFPRSCRRVIEAAFDGGDITSDAGYLLLRQADRRLQLSRRLSRVVRDNRRQASVEHQLHALLRQRIFGLAQGYEDQNDHDSLRKDIALQTAVGHDQDLASSSTLCRFEQDRCFDDLLGVHQVFVDVFLEHLPKRQKTIVLDLDNTDIEVHGKQDGRFFQGYYDHYCFLPLYVFCGRKLLVALLQPANRDGAYLALPVIQLLVERIRQERPKLRIILRGDSGFCRWRLMQWCEDNDVGYIFGIAKNKRLLRLAEPSIVWAEWEYSNSGEPYREFVDFDYAAGSWERKRRVICKAEHLAKGSNPRFIVTNLEGESRELYEDRYCARGDMENRIKEQQLGLFADRTSAHDWWPNQWRLLLSAAAYLLFEYIRCKGLEGTELAKAQVNTIRLKLLKVGAVVTRNTRRVRFHMSSTYPNQHLWWLVARALAG